MSLKLIFQFLILTTVVSGVLIFFLKKILFDSTQGAVNRLNRETEMVRAKQAELNEKIKQANEELAKRRAEADALVAKMATDAEEKAKQEREKIVNKARAEAEEIINKAQKTKEDMRKALEKDLDLRAIDFSVYVMNDVFSERSLTTLNDGLIEEFLESLKTVDMEMIDPKLNEAEIVLFSPLAEKYRNQLNDILQQKLGRLIELKVVEDKKIIGGIILKFESLSLDGSLRYLLKEKGVDVKNKLEKGLIKV